jgi:hypothetical protein
VQQIKVEWKKIGPLDGVSILVQPAADGQYIEHFAPGAGRITISLANLRPRFLAAVDSQNHAAILLGLERIGMFWFRRTSLICNRPRRRVLRNSRPAWQRATGWFSIVLYSVLALGIPLPLDAAPKSGEVFPCMHHRCGCHSAEQCWRDCCCMTMAEKLVWARENNVTPPEYVLAEAAKALHDEEPTAKCCCCHAEPTKTCCKAKSPSNCCGAQESNVAANVKSKPVSSGIVLLSALKCRGIADNWTCAPISLTPPAPIVAVDANDIVVAVAETTQIFSTRATSPPTPPPRFSIA